MVGQAQARLGLRARLDAATGPSPSNSGPHITSRDRFPVRDASVHGSSNLRAEFRVSWTAASIIGA